MRSSLAAAAKAGLLASRWYARRLAGDRLPGVLVLCYHGVRSSAWRVDEMAFPDLHLSADTFNGHCKLIAETCHPISLDDWRAARAGGRPLPARPVLVTLDDGYRSVFDVARPILRQHAVPAAIFVCTEPIQHRRLLWFDAVARAQGETGVDQYRSLSGARLREAVGACHVSADDRDPLAPMTVEQIRTLSDEGFEIGVHTAAHLPLRSLAIEEQREDLAGCRRVLEQWTGRAVTALAYPWGKPLVDYTAETVAIAERLGFDAAFTTRADYARPGEPSLERSRFLMLSAVSTAELAHRIVWSWPRA